MSVIKSKHTQLFIAVAAAEVIKVTRLRSVGFPDGQASEIDISDFDDDWDKFVAGRKATGSTTLEINYDATDHQKIEALHTSGAVVDFLVTAPKSETEGVEKPEAVDGVITPPTDVVSKQFKGFVQNFAVQVADNDIWKATITIRGSGAVITHRPAP
ncbi:phage tail tube protein [Stenotrophomonas rhizophila]|uniref:phage tail tube protein n=1 Tax=Stenotrophomonas rhizophila TaxID=216778 RepID=UPI0028D6CE7E|nr:phage tail tube protein [Stenotrophomonas rhizophila]